ncbi:LOW QUALITY PROTEIN: metalloprotease TIKI1 [Urocitellus parryii]
MKLNYFLWIHKVRPTSYSFGIIHVPTLVWDFITNDSKKAFQQSNIMYFELDLMDSYIISALSSCQMMPKARTDVLTKDIYYCLKCHLEYVKLRMPLWMIRPIGKGLYVEYLFTAIVGNERKRLMIEMDIKSWRLLVLDLYLAKEAEWLRKQTGAVEEVEEQCHPLYELNLSQVIFALDQTLLQQKSLSQMTYIMNHLIILYNCDDLSSVIFSHSSSLVPNFINAMLQPQEHITAQEINSDFCQELIYKWNERMEEQGKALLEEFPDKGFFFVFRAGSLLLDRLWDLLPLWGEC